MIVARHAPFVLLETAIDEPLQIDTGRELRTTAHGEIAVALLLDHGLEGFDEVAGAVASPTNAAAMAT